MSGTARSAIIGLGFSTLSRKPAGSVKALAAEAIVDAVADAGIALGALDGLLLVQSEQAETGALGMSLRNDLGLGSLGLLGAVQAKGSSVLQMVQQATMAIGAGLATNVACVFSDAPLSGQPQSGPAYARPSAISAIPGWEERYGLFGAIGAYALAAQRYLALHGLTGRDLGAYAIACRRWAQRNERALARTPIDIEDYLAAPAVVEPFRVLDCAYPVNGAAAIIVTGVDRARERTSPVAYVHGMGQGHTGLSALDAVEGLQPTGGRMAVQRALQMAGIALGDVTSCQIYDAFSFSALFALEDIGFCKPGEAPAFVADGHTSPGGTLPTNTGGGQLASYYLQGMTPLSEAVIQAFGRGGDRQTERNDVALVTGSGGLLEYHAALIISPHRQLS
jgi:acetyl-CoA acetyltransferase